RGDVLADRGRVRRRLPALRPPPGRAVQAVRPVRRAVRAVLPQPAPAAEQPADGRPGRPGGRAAARRGAGEPARPVRRTAVSSGASAPHPGAAPMATPGYRCAAEAQSLYT